MLAGTNSTASRDRRFFICAALLLSFTFSLGAWLRELPIIPPGPITAVYEVAKSLWEHGSLTPGHFISTYEEAAALSKESRSDVWQDVFALDAAGSLKPKHSILSSVVAVPFYALFGIAGFWVLQQICLIVLLYSTYLLVEDETSTSLPWSTLIATCFLSPTLFYSYTFSYDLHGCALLIGGLCLSRRFPASGGFIMALSVFARPSYVLMVVPLSIYRRGLPSWSAITWGALTAGGILLAFNQLLWGNAFTTSYSRLPMFHNGTMVLSYHPLGFDISTFLSNWSTKLVGPAGLLPFNLALLGFPWVVTELLRCRDKNFLWMCFLVAVGYSLYIFSYPMWDVSTYGNRFLLPAIFLYLLCFIPLLGRLELRWRARR